MCKSGGKLSGGSGVLIERVQQVNRSLSVLLNRLGKQSFVGNLLAHYHLGSLDDVGNQGDRCLELLSARRARNGGKGSLYLHDDASNGCQVVYARSDYLTSLS